MTSEIWVYTVTILRTAAVVFYIFLLPGLAGCYLLFSLETVKGIPRLFLVLSLSFLFTCLICISLLFIFGNLQPNHYLIASTCLIGAMFGAGLIRWRRSSSMQARRILGKIITPAALRVQAGTLLLILLLSTAAVMVDQAKPRGLTELYFIDPQFQIRVAEGDHLRVPYGIRNVDGRAHIYRIEIRMDGQTVAYRQSISLADEEVWEEIVQLDMSAYDGYHLLEVFLYEDGHEEPDLELQTWLTR
jgi:uncharacterized membrane protein